MGILRADLLTHSQLSNTSGSIQLDGTTDFIQVPSSEAWRIGLANVAHKSVTIEWWIYLNTTSGYHNAFDINYTSGLVIEGTNGVYSVYGGGQTLINEGILDAAVANRWYHYALVIHGGPAATPKSIFLYRDGKLSGAGKIDSNVAIGSNSNNLSIGARQSNGANSLNGYISNFRWSDEVVYNSEFTVPKFNLKARPSTLLLCCQSSTSATEAAVSVTGSVTASGNATHSSFNPGLKDDITDTGVVFDGFGSFATSTYMVPPSGKTTERNRGRAVFAGGYDAQPGRGQWMKYLSIQSGGLTTEFGDMLAATDSNAGTGNATRGLIIGGDTAPTNLTDTIQYITFATTSNATDFGNTSSARRLVGALANNTRAVYGGGTAAPVGSDLNAMEYITIATTGNATDFGDLTQTLDSTSALSSPTRGVFIQGINPSNARLNVMEYITIASTGNAADFGDTTAVGIRPSTGSSSTRGVYAGGDPASGDTNETNIIGYITIASTGNATDFGDLVLAVTSPANGQACSPTRMLVSGGNAPGATYNNIIQMITIETLGNAVDWGDLTEKTVFSGAAMSDSHGGLS